MGAQIKENAKKARKDLENAMHSRDHKIANFRRDSKAARSRLSAQFAAQDKATRAWANNKIKALVASTAAQFNDVETKMAKNRHEIDMALRQATMRFEASLNAMKALEDKRYASTVADIAAAKKEAAAKVDAASTEFKVQLLTLSSTVKQQVQKVNERIDATAGVVRSDAAAQAKVNANVNAEMTRMIKLGNDRYKKHLKDDMELQNLINKDKATTDAKLDKMALSFNNALAAVRKQLAADRKHSEDQLKKQTGAVWEALYKQQEMQEKKNAELEAATRRMRLDAMDAVRIAKEEFRKKIADLGKVVAENDKKADAGIEKLTGLVKEEEIKSAKGRAAIRQLEEANKAELKTAIHKAIVTGEKRAQLVEERGVKMDKDTKWLVNNKLNSEITKLRDETDASVESLALLNKEARDQMKKEMLYAIRTAAEVAKTDLSIAIKEGEKKMIAFEAKAAASHAASAVERQALKDEIASNAAAVTRMITDAVATDARAQAALGQETAAAIKKTNKNIDAYAQQMKEISIKTRDDIAAQTKATLASISEEHSRVNAAVAGFTAEDKARQESALEFLKKELAAAGEAAEKKFGEARARLADDRAAADQALGAATDKLNDSLAKQAALADSRFEKTVKDIAEARKEAAEEVAEFRKEFTVALAETTALVKNTETKLVGEIGKISGEIISMKANQARVNEIVEEELVRIEELSNHRYTESKKARGKLREIMEKNKQAAAEEVATLETHLKEELGKLRATNAHNKIEMAKDLSDATTKFYEKLSAQQKAQLAETEELNAATEAAKIASANELAHAKEDFDSKIIMLTNNIAANKKTEIMEADLNKALDRAISIGEAKAKAVEQRIAEHLSNTKRFLQVELNEQVEAAADSVLAIIEGKRQKIADNYLSLKAYAVAAADKIEDYVTKGKGRGMSSIGDLLVTVGGMGAVKATPTDGLGMGGTELPLIFSGDTVEVSNAVAAINGLVNEYTTACGDVRNRWPMGLGKYLLDKLETSMLDAGVLQVDTVEGHSGNYVYMNGRAVGLSNKLSDFSSLAASMSTYEAVLAKLTSKITVPKGPPPQFEAPPPEWE